MGIVNLTPDSFYDGGAHADVPTGLAHALHLLEDGADMVDLGAESSRPGAEEVPAQHECARLLPVLTELVRAAPAAVISVDTYHAVTAAAALEAGACVINDISACTFDPGLTDVLVQYKPGYVLMHGKGRPREMQVQPSYSDVRRDVTDFFERELHRLTTAGLPEEHIVLDPGIGFGKSLAHNLALLSHVEDWVGFGRPLLVGLSMKSLFGDLLNLAPQERGAAVQTASALLWTRGVFWHRVHEVSRVCSALRLAAALQGNLA